MWRNRDFRRLYAATTVSGLGSWLLVMAVPLHVFALTGSALSTGAALAVEALPAILIGPWAGVAVDRWPRKPVLIAANVAGAAGVALMAFDRIGFVYIGLLVEQGAMILVRPAAAAVTPALVGRGRDLAAANSLTAFTNSAWRMLGPPVGTALVARGWFTAVVLVDAASYVAAAAILTGITIAADREPARPGRSPARRRARRGRGSMRPERTSGRFRDGLRHLALLRSSWLFWTANAGLTTLLIPFAVARLHSSAIVGTLIAGLGIGYLCGSALSRIVVPRFPTRGVVAVSYVAVALCFAVLFTATGVPTALAAATASGVPGAVAQVATAHRLQASTPDAVLGRVTAVFAISDAVAAVAGALIAPLVVALTGLDAALLILSATVALAALLLIRRPAPSRWFVSR